MKKRKIKNSKFFIGLAASVLVACVGAGGVLGVNEIKKLKDTNSDQLATITKLEEENDGLRADIEAKTAELNTARTNLTRVQNELATSNANLAQARADKENLQTQLNSANADKARLTAELASANGDKAELEEQLNVVNARITSLNSQLAENAELIAGLETEVDELTGSVNTLTARIAELEAQLEEAQYDAGYTLTEDNSNFNFGYKDETGYYCMLSKNLVNDEMSPVSILTTMQLKSILNGQVSNCFTDENFMLEIPSMDISTYVMKHKLFHVNYRENLTTNINIVAKDTNGEIFDLQGLNKLNKSTYYVKLTNVDYVTYTNQELSSENVNSHELYLKSISIEISVELAEYSDEEILIPELGTYMTEDGSRGYQFYTDDYGTTWYKTYANGVWNNENIVYNFSVGIDNIMRTIGRYDCKWLTSDSFILLEYGTEVDGVVFTKQPAIDLLKDTLANGGYVRLTEDITLDNETLEVTAENVTIDLCGHTITGANIDGAVFKVNAGSQLALVGTGTIRGGSGADCRCVEVQGLLHIQDNVTMSVGSDANGQGNSCIFVNADGARVGIGGGTFETDADWNGFYYVVNIKNNVQNADISIWGGRFKNYNPATGDDVLGGNFVFTAGGYFVQSETVGTDTYYSVVHRELETEFFGVNHKIKVYNNNDFEFLGIIEDDFEILEQGTIAVDENTGIVTLTFSNGRTQEIQLNEELTSFELDGETFVMFNPEIHYEFYGDYSDVDSGMLRMKMEHNYTFKLMQHIDHYNEELDQYEPEDIERTGTFETHFDEMTGEGTITFNFSDGTTIVGNWDCYNGYFNIIIDDVEYFFAR